MKKGGGPPSCCGMVLLSSIGCCLLLILSGGSAFHSSFFGVAWLSPPPRPLWVGLVGFLLHWVVLPAFLSSKQHHPQGKWKKAPPPKKKRGTRKKQHHPRGESSTTPKEGAGTLSTLCLENTKVLMLHKAKKKRCHVIRGMCYGSTSYSPTALCSVNTWWLLSAGCHGGIQ